MLPARPQATRFIEARDRADADTYSTVNSPPVLLRALPTGDHLPHAAPVACSTGCRARARRSSTPSSPPAPAPAAWPTPCRSSRACSPQASPRPRSPSRRSSPRLPPPPSVPRSCTRTFSRAGCSTASPTRGPRLWVSSGGADGSVRRSRCSGK